MIHYSKMWRIPAVLLVPLLLGWASAWAADTVVAETLDNGLRVLLLEDHRSPIVSFQVWYRVGSRNEARGATGIAHFLEQNGGQDNAFTSHDVTSYFVDIAADKLDLVIELDADRMQNLLLDPKEIDSERQVVLEERRTRTDDDPGGFLGEEVASLAFRAHPYGFPVIGWREDIARITPEEIRAFYRTYYVPNNVLIVAVGDFRSGEALERIKRRFGQAPRGPVPPPVLAVEPPPNGERRGVVRKQAELPIVYVAYHVPNHRSDDAAPLEVLSTVLSGGRASRLYRDLVYERRLALEAGGDYSYFSVDPNLFWFWATAMPGQRAETLEKELLAQVERLKKEPVTDEELQRAKNQLEASFVFQEDSVHHRASLLARFEVIGGYAQKDQFLAKIRAVTAADLVRVAGSWFPEDKKNVGILLPKP